jgi:DNA-binding beta-propeller fold protein YncE
VLVLDAASGRVLRTTDVGGNPGDAVVDRQSGRLFVLTSNSRGVGVLDARTGTLLRTVRVGLYPQHAMVDEPAGRVVVTAGDGSVSMLDARTGRLRHRTVLSTIGPGTSPGLLAVDGSRGRVLVATPGDASGDTVTVLDERSGTVLRTVPVGGVAVAIAMDQRSGHAFVIGEDTIVRVSDAWSWTPPWLRRWLPFVTPPGPHTRMLPGSVTVLDATR